MGSLTKDEGYKAGKEIREDILRKREDEADAAEAAAEGEYDSATCSMYGVEIDTDVDAAEKRRREAEREVALDRAIAIRANKAKRINTIRENLGLSWRNPHSLANGMQYGLPLSFTPDGTRLPSPLSIAANKLNAEDLHQRLLLKLPATLPKLPESIGSKRTRTYSG